MTLLRVKPMSSCGCEPNFYSRPVNREVGQREGSEMSDRTWKPVTDIFDTEDSYVLKMEIPGYTKEDVNIEFKDNILSISGEKKDEFGEDASVLRTERRSGKFARSFKMPNHVDGQRIDATLKNGVLELKIAKPEEKKPLNIPINFN